MLTNILSLASQIRFTVGTGLEIKNNYDSRWRKSVV